MNKFLLQIYEYIVVLFGADELPGVRDRLGAAAKFNRFAQSRHVF